MFFSVVAEVVDGGRWWKPRPASSSSVSEGDRFRERKDIDSSRTNIKNVPVTRRTSQRLGVQKGGTGGATLSLMLFIVKHSDHPHLVYPSGIRCE